MNKYNRTIVLAVVIAVIIGVIFYIQSGKVSLNNKESEIVNVVPRVINSQENMSTATTSLETKNTNNNTGEQMSFMTQAEKSKIYPLAKEITTPDGFINTDGKPIKISDYVGKKVILVDFWTYSCINCQRTTPYLNEWYKKYEDKGLIIIGIHTPEFDFEKNYDNVKNATEKLGIKFPVVLDNDFSTWTAYNNHYWPHKYLIDIDGYIVYDHIGEGGYDETEKRIQEALTERKIVLNSNTTIPSDISSPTNAVTKIESGSPETYFGSSRNEYLANGTSRVSGPQSFVLPNNILLNKLYLSGSWNISDEYATNISSTASIVYKYKAKNLFFVASAESPTIITILKDGKPLLNEAGADVINKNGKSQVNIKEARLYKLIEDPNDASEHTIEIKIEGKGLNAFTFTFG